MLTPKQIERRALNRYPDFLRSLCNGAEFFPLAVFGGGLANPKDFVADRAGIQLLQNECKESVGFGYEITWEERRFRRLGAQRVPATVGFTTQNDYVRFLKKQAEVRQFQADFELIQKLCPKLVGWAKGKPLKVVAQAGRWPQLLDVCVYLRSHPRPGCYLRELPVVVDTKFIENHKGVLAELLPIAAPQTVGEDNSSFEVRFGFRSKRPLVRMRFLDQQLPNQLAFPVTDFSTPLDQFCGLPFGSKTILIVENEMTFLTLPELAGTIAIFGGGDAAALLTCVSWLDSCRLFYWGDLDAHGFETLSHLRRRFPQIISILMDKDTFENHSAFVVNAGATRSEQISGLSAAEQALYARLIEEGILLEQERIPNSFSMPRLLQTMVP